MGRHSVLHVVPSLSLRQSYIQNLPAIVCESSRRGLYSHRILVLDSFSEVDVESLSLADVEIVAGTEPETIREHCKSADIVQVEWINHPALDLFLRNSPPKMRLLVWCHVHGAMDPQFLPRSVLDISDFFVAGHPGSYEAIAVQSLVPEQRLMKTEALFGGLDISQCTDTQPDSQAGFCVGYCGSLRFSTLHKNFVPMSAAANIPDVRFTIFSDDSSELLEDQCARLKQSDNFRFHVLNDADREVFSGMNVFGFPLAEDAPSSLSASLQKAMAAGIPPVVFPHAGLDRVIIDRYSGLIVRSELEYGRALEYLFENEDERCRLGANARAYALQMFSVERSVDALHVIYQGLLTQEKRERVWGIDPSRSLLEQRVTPADLGIEAKFPGTERFLQSLCDTREYFEESIRGEDLGEVFAADESISSCTTTMREQGLFLYRSYYPEDPYLALWHGLLLYGEQQWDLAMNEFATSLSLGLDRSYVLWYAAQAALHNKQPDVAIESLSQLIAVMPEFNSAQLLLAEVESGKTLADDCLLNEFHFVEASPG